MLQEHVVLEVEGIDRMYLNVYVPQLQLIYYKFLHAAHQSCAAHLIRRCRDLAAVATPAAARFPLAVQHLLEQGLAWRDRYLEPKISLHGLWTATGRREAKLNRLRERNDQDPANRRLAKHLRHERPICSRSSTVPAWWMPPII